MLSRELRLGDAALSEAFTDRSRDLIRQLRGCCRSPVSALLERLFLWSGGVVRSQRSGFLCTVRLRLRPTFGGERHLASRLFRQRAVPTAASYVVSCWAQTFVSPDPEPLSHIEDLQK